MILLDAQEILSLLRSTGALLEGHFILTSGRHSDRYVQCALLLQYPNKAALVGRELAGLLARYEPQVVVGPALGGILVAHEVARALNVRGLFAERKEGRMQLRRGFTISPGERVVVVEDVVTTGGSVREVMDVVEACGGRVVAVGALVDRSGGKVSFGVPFVSLLAVEMASYEAASCPLCAAGIPAVKPGSREGEYRNLRG